MMHQIRTILILLILTSSCKKDDTSNFIEEVSYEINENGLYQDFLTPNYYTIDKVDLRFELNKFIYFARNVKYQHPFQDPNGDIASYSVNRDFGDGIGLGGTSQHHPALDLYPTNSSNIIMYAAHEGTINTYTNNSIYRNYLTITKNIKDLANNSIGKLVTIYAHIDLELDESQLIQLHGRYVNKGDLISENLYAGTVGGPHLHFEIRFYKNSENGNEDFYNWKNIGDYTRLSSGVWSYGYWNPNIGYGFGNPMNFGVE